VRTFSEFWPFYCREHSRKATRWIHFAGSLAGPLAALFAAFATGRLTWLFLWPVLGYGLAWSAHLLVEKNRPATFRHPLWSLVADYRMVAFMLAGRMDDEVARAAGAGA
jgi:hypothetical protein